MFLNKTFKEKKIIKIYFAKNDADFEYDGELQSHPHTAGHDKNNNDWALCLQHISVYCYCEPTETYINKSITYKKYRN